MSKEERINRKQKKKRLRNILILIVIVYLFFTLTSSLYGNDSKTVIVKYDSLEMIEKTQGIIIRDEIVYRSDYQGQVKLLKDQGDKLAIGTKVIDVFINGDSVDLQKQLQEINEEIKKLSGNHISEEIFSQDIEKNQTYIDDLVKKIQSNLLAENYREVERLKKELEFRIGKNQKMSGQGGYVNYTLENLTKKKEEIIATIANKNKSYYADRTGILSYHIDGLEEIFSVESIEDFMPEDFRVIEKQATYLKDKQSIHPGDSLFKIADNFNWYVMAKLPKKGLEFLQEGKDVDIRFSKWETPISGNLHQINTVGEESLIIIKFDEHFHDLMEDRYIDIDVIKRRYEGLKIPKSSIVEKEGMKGVYIKDISNIVKFRPIKVMGEDEDYAIVYDGKKINKGDTRGRIEVNKNNKTESRFTIAMFDKVLVYGDKVKEGTIID